MSKTEEEYHFRGQQAGERVELAMRQHPFTIIEHALKVVLLLLLIPLLNRLFGATGWVTLVSIASLIGAVVIGIRSWYVWWNTMTLITNERVLFVEQRGVASRKISEAQLENIQFVTNEVNGLMHTMFNFGNVKIQTAGSVETLLLREIADPYAVQQRITHLQRQKS